MIVDINVVIYMTSACSLQVEGKRHVGTSKAFNHLRQLEEIDKESWTQSSEDEELGASAKNPGKMNKGTRGGRGPSTYGAGIGDCQSPRHA